LEDKVRYKLQSIYWHHRASANAKCTWPLEIRLS